MRTETASQTGLNVGKLVLNPLVCQCGSRRWYALLDGVDECPHMIVHAFMCVDCEGMVWMRDDQPRLANPAVDRSVN